MIKRITLLLPLILLISCSTRRMENTMVEHWVIQSIEYGGEKIKYGQGILFLNIMNFESDGTCIMPGWSESKTIEEKGNWFVEKNKKDYFLIVKNCPTNIYNNKYKIVIQKSFPKFISLESDSLKLFCGEVQY